MAGSSTYSWWQWARWVWNVARNSRITEPTGAELVAIKAYLKNIWNPQTQTGTRPWLASKFNRLSVTAAASNYLGDIDSEPTHVLVEMLGVVGRDLDDIPITDSEVVHTSVMIVATGRRRYGTGNLFGGVSGSTVTIP